MRGIGVWACLGLFPLWAGELPEKAARYHEALGKRPESAALFQRFRDAWLEERAGEELEAELRTRAEAGEPGAWAILARARLAEGCEAEALAAFETARESADSPWITLETAKLMLAARDHAGAEKRALAVPDGDKLRAEALKLAGLACLRDERLDDAMGHWMQAVDAAPGDAGLLEELTALTRREGRTELAMDFCVKWRDATEDAYTKAMATLTMSELLQAASRFDDAAAELAAVIGMSGEGSWLEREALARAREAFRQRGDTTGLVTWLAARTEGFPHRLELHRAHAEALAAAGKTEAALETLSGILRRSPGDTAARWQRVDLLQASLDFAKAFDECAALAGEEKSETGYLRLAELAFRLDRKDEVKRALNAVIAAADPARHVALADHFSRYGMPAETERMLRSAAEGDHAGAALRELAKFFRRHGRDREALATWQRVGALGEAPDIVDASGALLAADERDAARALLEKGARAFPDDRNIAMARAELASLDGDHAAARAIHLALARTAPRPDELWPAIQSWLGSSRDVEDPLRGLGEETADRCIRAAWLATSGGELPPIRAGDELERALRLTILRAHGRWPEVVAMLEAAPGPRNPLFLADLADAKAAAGDLEGALACTREWRARANDQPAPWLREADLLERLGNADEAARLLRRAAARFEDDEAIAKRLFALWETLGATREATAWAWTRHDRAADAAARASWLREIIRVAKETDSLAPLREALDERARRDPSSPVPLLMLAELAEAGGNPRERVGFLRRAAAAAPHDPEVLIRLAKAEEQYGDPAAALKCYAEIARTAPGPENAWQLGHARIRMGEIEHGVRDLQALAGDKGLDLRVLEQTAGDLATGGHLDEAIRLLRVVDETARDARHEFMLGTLCALDGRAPESLTSLGKVLAEEPDPNEAAHHDDPFHSAPGRIALQHLIYRLSHRASRSTGHAVANIGIPGSLWEAKNEAQATILRIGLDHSGEAWEQAVRLVPELAAATHPQWQEVVRFQNRTREQGYGNWTAALEAHPGNPLLLRLALEMGRYSTLSQEKAAEILDRHPDLPLPLRIALWSQAGTPTDEQLSRLEAIGGGELRQPEVASAALLALEAVFRQETADAELLGRAVAILDQLPLQGAAVDQAEFLRMSHALASGDIADFARRANRRKPAQGEMWGHGSRVDSLIAKWQGSAEDGKTDELLPLLESPGLRLRATLRAKRLNTGDKAALALIDAELAALPADAPAGFRREIVTLKWEQLGNDKNAILQELRTRADDESDPALALLALVHLQHRTGAGMPSPHDQQRIQALAIRLEKSADATDRQLAQTFGRHVRRSAPPATRWGAARSFHFQGRGQFPLSALLAMEDKELAAREVARGLVALARASRIDHTVIASLKKAGLLAPALAHVQLPADAGLCHRVAIFRLLDACGETDRARPVLAAIAADRPWETRWAVELALRAAGRDEMSRLLDPVAERDDFDVLLPEALATLGSGNVELPLEVFERLADWAPAAKGRREWVGRLAAALVEGNAAGLRTPTPDNAGRIACLHRYLGLALQDPRLADLAFRIWRNTPAIAKDADLPEIARRALLTGTLDHEWPSGDLWSNLPGMSAIEFLCTESLEKGDDAVFPEDFRRQLATSAPASAAWLDPLLSAKRTSELPDLAPVSSADPAAAARHRSAMLRAASLEDRDAWVLDMFRSGRFDGLGAPFATAIRRDLAAAKNSKDMRRLVVSWIEAAKEADGGKNAARNGPFAAFCIVTAAAETDAPTLLAVLAILRDTECPVTHGHDCFRSLGRLWAEELRGRGSHRLADLPAATLGTPLETGCWRAGGKPGELVWEWGFPTAAASLRQNADPNKRNPAEASLVDLLQRAAAHPSPATQLAALHEAMPQLRKLPAAFRDPVLDHLISRLGSEHLAALPEPAAGRLRAKLDRARDQRLAEARKQFEQLKSAPGGFTGKGNMVGSLVGRIVLDDPAFVAEVIEAWKPAAEADRSGKDFHEFVSAMDTYGPPSAAARFAMLHILDGLQIAKRPNPRKGNHDPLSQFMTRFQAYQGSSAFWRDLGPLSPEMQARVCMRLLAPYPRPMEPGEGETPASLRKAASGLSSFAGATLDWLLHMADLGRNREMKTNAALLLRLLHALEQAGPPAEMRASFGISSMRSLDRFDRPELLVDAIPGLLAEINPLGDDDARALASLAVQRWRQLTRNVHGPAAGPIDPEARRALVALLDFVLTHSQKDLAFLDQYSITQSVWWTEDPALLERWVDKAGKQLAGNGDIILTLLRKDRIAAALALIPEPNKYLTFDNTIYFDASIEEQMAKLAADPTPESLVLRVRVSCMHDHREGDPPKEPRDARLARLASEFERRHKEFPLQVSARIVGDLGLISSASNRHIPLLDHFADDESLKSFQQFAADPQATFCCRLILAAACSRLHAEDPAPLQFLADTLAAFPREQAANGWIVRQRIPEFVLIGFIHHAIAHDGTLPGASARAARAIALATAGRGVLPGSLGDIHAALILHVAVRDPDPLAKDLETAGVPKLTAERCLPVVDPPTRELLARIGIGEAPEPADMPADSPHMHRFQHDRFRIFPRLADPELRKGISPAEFEEGIRFPYDFTADELANARLYLRENTSTFDQRRIQMVDQWLRAGEMQIERRQRRPPRPALPDQPLSPTKPE